MNRVALLPQHVLISGGSRGIGLACAKVLSKRFQTLSLLAREKSALEKAAHEIAGKGDAVTNTAQVFFAACDVTDPEQVRVAVQQLTAKGGPITVLINNAGLAESAPFLKTSLEFWDRSLNLNLKGTVTLTQAVLPAMMQAKSGRVINIASTAGLKGYPYVTAYCATKHAVVGLTRALALEYATSGITINAVCPGFTDTPMLRSSISTVARVSGQTEDTVKEQFLKNTPMGRFIEPHEVASAVLWLAEPQQSAVTGQVITINGGEST